jgi:CheY-like chemotaxis protein
LGKGSEFIIHLPALPEAGAENPLPPAHPDVAFGANGTRRVLVVDDIADAAVSLGELLEIWGHDVRTAHSGPAALKLLCDFMPDVVLMDIGMPEMNGCEVARRMRQLECGRNLRLVALTGYGQTQDREETQAAGFDDHLVKPVDLEALRKLLAAAMPHD